MQVEFFNRIKDFSIIFKFVGKDLYMESILLYTEAMEWRHQTHSVRQKTLSFRHCQISKLLQSLSQTVVEKLGLTPSGTQLDK